MKLSTYFLAACLSFSSALQAQTALEQFNAFTASMQSARGEFKQSLVKKELAKNSLSSGSFSFARPGKFRWTYTQPYQQLLVANGQKLWIYDPDLNQVTVKKLGNALGEAPAALLFGNASLADKFKLKNLPKRDGLEWLEAAPKNPDSNFERVLIGFANGLPQSLELHDAFGQTTLLNFQRWVTNPTLNAQEFQFTPPPGTDVFEQ